MADNENSAKPKQPKRGRAQHQARMKRRQQKKAAAAAQAVSSQTTSDAPLDSAEPSQEISVASSTTPNGVAPPAVAPSVQAETPQTPPQEPTNAWEKKPVPQQPQPKPRLNGGVAQRPAQRPPIGQRPPPQRPSQRPVTNGHPILQIPTRPARPQQPNDRSLLFKGKTVVPQSQPIQPPRSKVGLGSKVSVQARLRHKHLVGSMPDDYVAPVRTTRASPRKEQPPLNPIRPRGPPISSRPTRPTRPTASEAKRPQRERRTMKNGRPPMQNGSSNGREEPRQKATRQTPRHAKTNGSSNRPLSSSSTSSPSSSRATRSSSQKQKLSKSPSTATSSSSSSPMRRAKKDLRKVGMKKVTNGKRIIKKSVRDGTAAANRQAAVWLNGDISDPALQPSDSKLNPEAPLFESTAILTDTGAFLNDDYYRPNGMMIPMTTQPLPQMPVAPQPAPAVTPSEPDFSQAANNYPSYQPVYPDMFGSGDNYYNYSAAYSMYPTTDGFMSGGPAPHATQVPSQFGAFGNYPNEFSESYPQFHSTNHPGSGYYPSSSGYASQSTGAYSGTASRYVQNGASGTTTGTTSVSTSQDFSQMMAPTHVPNGVHTNGSVAVVNGNTGQGTSSTSVDLAGVSSSAVSEQSGAVNDSSMSETQFMYENAATGYYSQLAN